MFIHTPLKVDMPTLRRKNENGKRVYYDNDDNRYESVTNVVGYVDQKGLQEWRDNVGEDVANSRKRMRGDRFELGLRSRTKGVQEVLLDE